MPFNSLSEIVAFKQAQGFSPEEIERSIRLQQAAVDAAQDAETAARIAAIEAEQDARDAAIAQEQADRDAAIAAARIFRGGRYYKTGNELTASGVHWRPNFDAYHNAATGWPTSSDGAEGHMFQVNSTMGNGLYLVSFSAHWVFHASATKRSASIYHRPSGVAIPGNTEWISEFSSVAGSVSRTTMTGPIRAEVGDFIGVAALQDTGGDMSIVGGTARTKLEIIKLQDH